MTSTVVSGADTSFPYAWGLFNTLHGIILPLLGLSFAVIILGVLWGKRLKIAARKERRANRRNWRGRGARAGRNPEYLAALEGTVPVSPRAAAVRMALLSTPRKVAQNALPRVLGHIPTQVVHLEGCNEIARGKGLRAFDSVEEAVGQGFQKCEVCLD